MPLVGTLIDGRAASMAFHSRERREVAAPVPVRDRRRKEICNEIYDLLLDLGITHRNLLASRKIYITNAESIDETKKWPKRKKICCFNANRKYRTESGENLSVLRGARGLDTTLTN